MRKWRNTRRKILKTEQEIFDIVSTHLLKQDKQSRTRTTIGDIHFVDSCMYRGSEGRKCAIGCLIPDDQYVKAMEGNNMLSPLMYNCLYGQGIDVSKHLIFLSHLQHIHDRSEPEDWERMLEETARCYHLELKGVLV